MIDLRRATRAYMAQRFHQRLAILEYKTGCEGPRNISLFTYPLTDEVPYTHDPKYGYIVKGC